MYNHQCYPQGTAKHFCAEDFSPRAKWFQAISILRSSRLPPQQTESDLNVPLEVCKWLGSKNNWSYITSWNIFGIAITHTWKIIPLFPETAIWKGQRKKPILRRSILKPSGMILQLQDPGLEYWVSWWRYLKSPKNCVRTIQMEESENLIFQLYGDTVIRLM